MTEELRIINFLIILYCRTEIYLINFMNSTFKNNFSAEDRNAINWQKVKVFHVLLLASFLLVWKNAWSKTNTSDDETDSRATFQFNKHDSEFEAQ